MIGKSVRDSHDPHESFLPLSQTVCFLKIPSYTPVNYFAASSFFLDILIQDRNKINVTVMQIKHAGQIIE